MNYVIGSGPSGVSAAAALLDQGLQVTLLDAGGELELEQQRQADGLSRRLPASWSRSELENLRGRLQYNSEGAPLKQLFGSDYPYRDVERHEPLEKTGVDAYRSYANGGLSTLWGASVLPYTDSDLAGWPISASELGPHYAAVLGMTGLSATRDDLESIYPLFIEPTTHLALSRQATALLEKMGTHAQELKDRHIRFGEARLAIGRGKGAAPSCVLCGMCLYGCPYELIHSSRLSLARLLAESKNIKYLPGNVVYRLKESSGIVRIHARAREGGEERIFEASRVFLAAGVFSSTRIILESLETYDRPLPLQQSDHFLLPLLHWRVRGSESEQLHTLSQLFVELMDRSISRHTVHLQVYTYNDFYARMAQDKLGPLYPLAAPLLRPIFERLLLIKGYLHSNESSGIRATLSKVGGGSSHSMLKLEGVQNEGAGESSAPRSGRWPRAESIPGQPP